jgi:hypothetical protein
MTLYEYYIVYPDGEKQEMSGTLRIDQLVDLNGRPLELPLPTARMIVYRVIRIQHTEERGIHSIYYGVELVGARELVGLAR